MGTLSSKLPLGNNAALQEICVKINYKCTQAYKHTEGLHTQFDYECPDTQTYLYNENTQRHQEHKHVFSLNFLPVCATIRFLPLVACAWPWCSAPPWTGWAVRGAKFSAGGQEPACPRLPVVQGTGKNLQQEQLKQHSWRAASGKTYRIQELHRPNELKEWKTCTDIV